MTSPELSNFLVRIENDFRHNILPFWMNRVVNPTNGSFHGSLTSDLVPDPSAERGALLSSRILWTFAAAYRRYRDPAYLKMAEYAYADLLARFRDREYGGFYWSIAADETVLRDRKQIYGQAFAIYALTEYSFASGLREPLDEAIAVYRLIEAHARDPKFGGYFEAFARDWSPIADMRLSAVDLNEPKSQNTHLHIMEAYTNLLQAWPDSGLKTALTALVKIMLERIVNPATSHLGLFFAEDWSPRSNRVSYGHDIEAAWLFTQAAEAIQDSALTEQIRALAIKIADVTLAEGIDEDGGVFYEGSPDGLTNTDKEWWPQAEAVVGFLNAYQLSKDKRFLATALRIWAFIERKIVDRLHGEWFRGVTREGRVLDHELKVSFWKCPYHNGRTGLEATARLHSIIQNP